MNKITIFLFFIAFCFTSTVTLAQQQIATADLIITRPQAVFFEILGTGGLYSVNYLSFGYSF